MIPQHRHELVRVIAGERAVLPGDDRRGPDHWRVCARLRVVVGRRRRPSGVRGRLVRLGGARDRQSRQPRARPSERPPVARRRAAGIGASLSASPRDWRVTAERRPRRDAGSRLRDRERRVRAVRGHRRGDDGCLRWIEVHEVASDGAVIAILLTGGDTERLSRGAPSSSPSTRAIAPERRVPTGDGDPQSRPMHSIRRSTSLSRRSSEYHIN